MTDIVTNNSENDCQHHFSSDDLSTDQNKKLSFDPPLYIQRYNYVSGLLFDFNCSSFMDIGCAECKLIHLLKQTNQNLNLIIGLDLDESILEKNKSKFTDNLVDLFHCRENPLDLYIIKGDISKPEKYFLDRFCEKNCGLDFVSMVEIIEHMYPETLKECIKTVFKHLRPKFVLISTPNSEFNVVFEENPYDERKINQKFRHWDHKFEWNRNEFQKWCKDNILNIYKSYKLFNNSFYGLGEPPKEFQDVGHCTQMALFYNQELIDSPEKSISIRNSFQAYLDEKKDIYLKNRYRNPSSEQIRQNLYYDNEDSSKKIDPDSFKLVYGYSYPFELYEFKNIDDRNRVVLDEINYIVSFLTSSSNYIRKNHQQYDPDNLGSHLTEEEKEKIDNDIDIYDDYIKLAKVDTLLNFTSLKKFKVPGDEIINLMKEAGYKFTKQDKFVIHTIHTESEDEDFSEHEDSYYELDSIESPRSQTDFLMGKVDEQFIENSFQEDKNFIKSNDAFNFEEENWDQYLPQVSEMPDLKFRESLSEQFQDADETDNTYSEEYIQKCLDFEFKTRRNRLRLTDFKSCNYNADNQKKCAYNLRAIRKRNRINEESPLIGQFSLD